MTLAFYCKCPDACTKCGAELPTEMCNVHANAFQMMKALDELLTWYEDIRDQFKDDTGFSLMVEDAKFALNKAKA